MKNVEKSKINNYEIINEGFKVFSGSYDDPAYKSSRVPKIFTWVRFNFTFRHKIFKDFIFMARYENPCVQNENGAEVLKYNMCHITFAFFDVINRKWNNAIFQGNSEGNWGKSIEEIAPINLTDTYNKKRKEISAKWHKGYNSDIVKKKTEKYIKQFILNCLANDIFHIFEKMCLIDVKMKNKKK